MQAWACVRRCAPFEKCRAHSFTDSLLPLDMTVRLQNSNPYSTTGASSRTTSVAASSASSSRSGCFTSCFSGLIRALGRCFSCAPAADPRSRTPRNTAAERVPRDSKSASAAQQSSLEVPELRAAALEGVGACYANAGTAAVGYKVLLGEHASEIKTRALLQRLMQSECGTELKACALRIAEAVALQGSTSLEQRVGLLAKRLGDEAEAIVQAIDPVMPFLREVRSTAAAEDLRRMVTVNTMMDITPNIVLLMGLVPAARELAEAATNSQQKELLGMLAQIVEVTRQVGDVNKLYQRGYFSRFDGAAEKAAGENLAGGLFTLVSKLNRTATADAAPRRVADSKATEVPVGSPGLRRTSGGDMPRLVHDPIEKPTWPPQGGEPPAIPDLVPLPHLQSYQAGSSATAFHPRDNAAGTDAAVRIHVPKPIKNEKRDKKSALHDDGGLGGALAATESIAPPQPRHHLDLWDPSRLRAQNTRGVF